MIKKSKKKVFFRADAGGTIGYGHFIRSLSLADMLKDDFECVFYTQSPTEYQVNECSKVCKLVELPSDDTRFWLFLNELKGDEIVVLDNYFYTTDYQQAIKDKGCKLVCIDDPHGIHYVCDVILSHGNGIPSDFDVEPYTRLCLGIDWAMLRKPFRRPVDWNHQRNNDIVVNFGGADPFHITELIIKLLLQLDLNYNIKVILGDKVYLSDECRGQVEVLKNLNAEQMAQLFDDSAFGIFAASTVCLEGQSRGLPMIVGYFVENQEKYYQRTKNSGNFATLDYLQDTTLDNLNRAIEDVPNIKRLRINPEGIQARYVKLFKSL